MKKFLKVLLFSLCFLVPLCIVVEIYSRTFENEYTYKNKCLTVDGKNIKVLLLGNSLFYNSLNPHELGDSVFDCAMSAREIFWDVQLLKRNLPNMSNLKTVIFPLSYVQLYRKEAEDPQLLYSYETYMGLSHENFIDRVKGRSCVLSKQADLGTIISKLMDNHYVPEDSLGCRLLVGKIDDWENVQTVPDTHEYNEKLIQKRTADLSRIADMCFKNGIRFVVVTPPCCNSYIAKAPVDCEARLFEMVNKANIHSNIEYHNYFNDLEFRDDSIYYNASHLNSAGASLLAIRLKKDLVL